MKQRVDNIRKLVVIQNFMVPYETPLFEALAKRASFELLVYYCKGMYKERRWSKIGATSYRFETLPGITVEVGGLVSSFNPGILGRLNREKPDAVVLSGGYNHITMQIAFVWAVAAQVPIVYRSDQNSITASRASKLRTFLQPVEKAMIRNASVILCPGEMSARYHVGAGSLVERVFTSPYTTADDSHYLETSMRLEKHRDSLKMELGLHGNRVLLFVGRLVPAKGVVFLLQSFKRLAETAKNLSLVILGDGPSRSELEKYCSENSLTSVRFAGFVPEETKVKYLSVADVLVLPSLSEPWGLVVNEAMLCGLPVITTNAVGASEMIVDGVNGFVVKTADSLELSDAISKILNDLELAASIRERGRATVLERYNLNRRVESFLDAVVYACDDSIPNRRDKRVCESRTAQDGDLKG